MPFRQTAKYLFSLGIGLLESRTSCQSTTTMEINNQLFLMFSRPGTMFIDGDPIMVSIFNPSNSPLEIVIIIREKDGKTKVVESQQWKANPSKINIPSTTGEVQIVARHKEEDSKNSVRSNSLIVQIFADTFENRSLVDQNRIMEHKLACAVQSTNTSILSLHNPWIIPGNSNYPDSGEWFPAPVWEGATSLYNEEEGYYRDPLQYFIEAIKRLQQIGVQFVTWHDLLDNQVDLNKQNVLLQFDVDAGPNSFLEVAKSLGGLGIRASVMVHWKAKHWYEYDFCDTGVTDYQDLEKNGWAIGYHNNTLSNLAGFSTDIDDEMIISASKNLVSEISELRRFVNIRTMTHHGGNVLNYKVPIPSEASVVCVDRQFSPSLWKKISRSFSDGSFTSRPTTFKAFVDSISTQENLLFMRCHPLKYGNFPSGIDTQPLQAQESMVLDEDKLRSKTQNGEELTDIEKQTVWMINREKTRDGVQLGYASPFKPLSSKFKYSKKVNDEINRLRSRRREGFLRQYPWKEGDPRVIWWRILSSFCDQGNILNVGAMPPEQKDETLVFLDPNCTLLEVDIDPERKPDIIADFCDSSKCCTQIFKHVLLNGLPYFSDPKAAVMNAQQYLEIGGSLLIGAAAASHPERGGLFRPKDRPIWRTGKIEKSGESLSLLTHLWSFDKTSIDDLMQGWSGNWKVEFMSHYWFIIAEKQNNG